MKKLNGWKLGLLIVGTVAVIAVVVVLSLFLLNEYHLDLTLLGQSEVTLEYGEDFTDPGAQAVYYGSIFQQEPVTVTVYPEGAVDVSKVGTYEIVYRAEHEGLTAEKTRVVRVVDTVAPELTLEGNSVVELPVGSSYEEPGYAAVDNYSGDVTASVRVDGTLDESKPGSYVLTYTARDESGNEASTQRTVVYLDVTAPVITLAGESRVEMTPGTAYEEPGYSAEDDCDGDLTDMITVEGTVDENVAGTYILTYTVTDAAGNTTQVTREIVYKDITAPVLTLFGNSVLEATIGNMYEDPGYSAIDETDGDLTAQVEITSNVSLYIPGTYTVTYTVTDAAGNSTSKSRTVVMHDITAKVSGGVIYLTFDDGPSAYTAQLLDVLAKYNVKATFFVVNYGYRSSMTRAAAEGHTIAIHSATHDFYQIYASEEAYFADLYKMQSIIQECTGQVAMLIRFPGGSSNTTSNFNPGIMTRLTKLVQERGFRYFDWNVSAEDAGIANTAGESSYRVIKGVSTRSTSVVLMHDSKSFTPKAVERIIQWGLANGYTFAPLTYDSPGCHHGVNN